jgi:hypothetical protein
MWKWGCLTVLIGLALTASSCVMCGTAAYRAASAREFARVPFTPGGDAITIPDVAAGDGRARLALDLTIELAPALVEKPRERADIVQCEVPVNYEVRDASGTAIQSGAAAVNGSTIVPEQASPHYASFDRRVKAHFRGEPFRPPGGGRVALKVDVPAADRDGNPVRSAYAVLEEAPAGALGWAGGGVAALFAGPVVALAGLVLFVIGLLNRRPAPPPLPRA